MFCYRINLLLPPSLFINTILHIKAEEGVLQEPFNPKRSSIMTIIMGDKKDEMANNLAEKLWMTKQPTTMLWKEKRFRQN